MRPQRTPPAFPRQIIEEGLRPWRVLRTFRGGVRAGEPFHVEVDATGSSPWLGDTWQRWASRGLGLQRSQTAGRVRTGGGRYLYERRDPMEGGNAGAGEVAASFFAGLDTSLGGLPALLGEAAPRASSLLDELQRSIAAVVEAFDFRRARAFGSGPGPRSRTLALRDRGLARGSRNPPSSSG